MRFFHISDLHLGKTLRGYDLLDDQAFILDSIVEAISQHKPDGLLIAGDIYDRAVPPVEAVQLFDHFLASARRAGKAGMAIVAIPGNHDSGGRLSFGASLLAKAGLHIAARADAEPVVLQSSGGERCAIWALPFLNQANAPWDDWARDAREEQHVRQAQNSQSADAVDESRITGPRIRSQEEMLGLALGRIQPHLERNDRNIILAHCFAAGSKVSESETGFVGAAEQVDAGLFADFDYTALGHLHSCQSPGPGVWYSGAPLALGVAEGEEERGYIEVDLEKEKCRVEFKPLSPKRRIRRITGNFDELVERAVADPGREDFIEFQLLDEEAVLNAAERLKTFYPRLLAVRQRAFEASLGAESEGDEEVLSPEMRSGDSLEALKADFCAFYKELKDSEPSENELALFEELAKEVADASK
jgi:exonuclease SbcD